MVKHYRLHEGKAQACVGPDSPIQLFINPSEEEKRHLIETFKIDEHTLSSAMDPDELARLEFEPAHMALIFKRPKNYCAADNFLFKVQSMGIFLFKNRLVVLLSEDVPFFENKGFSNMTSLADVMLKIIYRGIFHFFEHLKVINQMSDALEKKINTAMENKQLLNLFILEKSLVYYLNAINSNTMLIEKIKLNAAKIGILGETMELLDDIVIENNQCFKQAEIYSNILTGLMDARGSIVGNNLNVLMKTLNVITIGIMVPTLVVSAFSMNVTIPISGHPQAFYIIMGLAGLSVLGFLLFWRMKKW